MLKTYTGKGSVEVNKVLYSLNYREMFRNYVTHQYALAWWWKVYQLQPDEGKRCLRNIQEASKVYVYMSNKETGLDKETLQSDIKSARHQSRITITHFQKTGRGL